MPRKPRIEFAGAVYHVMCRGDRREAIFLDDADRERFLETLVEARERTGWRIHAYVLMVNHYHLLLETPEANLVAGMRWFQGTYTARFHHRHGVSGHLFQGRYKALPVAPDEEGYFLRVSSYIHLNPVRAKWVGPKDSSLAVYPWSSYPAYLKSPKRRQDWVEVSRVLGDLRLEDTASGRREYTAYMERRRAECRKPGAREEMESEWKEIRRGWYLGSEIFGEKVRDLVGVVVDGGARDSYIGGARAAHDESAAEKLLQTGLKTLDLKRRDLEGLRKSDPRKQVLAWWIRKQTAVSNQWVSDRLAMGHAGNLSKMVNRVERDPTRKMKRLKKQVRTG